MKDPFDVADVLLALEEMFRCDRFDADGFSSDSDDRSDRDRSESSDSDFSDSDEDDIPRKSSKTARLEKTRHNEQIAAREKLKAKRAEAGLTARQRLKVLEDEDQLQAESQEEMEVLIKRLQTMDINDTNYATLYYKALKKDRDIKFIVKPPVMVSETPSGPMYTPRPPRNSSGPLNSQNNEFRDNMRRDTLCYGCGKPGHTLNYCNTINDMINKGVVRRDNMGRIVMADSSPIRRNGTEPIVHAVQKRQEAVQTNLITSPEVFYYSSDSDSESDIFVLPAERTPKSTKEARKVHFEGVFPPPKPAWARKADGLERGNPRPVVPPAAAKSSPPDPLHHRTPTPVNTCQPTVEIDENTIMEDPLLPTPAVGNDPVSKSPPTGEKNKRLPQLQSAVSHHIQPLTILDRILNTPLTLSVSEVIGSSKEVNQQLQNVIKFKRLISMPDAAQVAATIITHNCGALIHLAVECDGNPVDSIVDTRSMINIVHQQVWKQVIHRPLDKSLQITMKDANGGEGCLIGLVQNVPVRCGGATTWANLYVAEQVPFAMLLGRPWQRGNHISMTNEQTVLT